jgi:hypothetical protein
VPIEKSSRYGAASHAAPLKSFKAATGTDQDRTERQPVLIFLAGHVVALKRGRKDAVRQLTCGCASNKSPTNDVPGNHWRAAAGVIELGRPSPLRGVAESTCTATMDADRRVAVRSTSASSGWSCRPASLVNVTKPIQLNPNIEEGAPARSRRPVPSSRSKSFTNLGQGNFALVISKGAFDAKPTPL